VHQLIKNTSSSDETFQLGQQIAKDFKPGIVVLINGTLGAGKTQIIKGICSHFGIDPKDVQSPTFALHHTYNSKDLAIHHFDLYRLKNTEDFFDRGFFDILELNDYTLIEWPSKVSRSIFDNFLKIEINIKIIDEHTREIEINYA
jgi:tRNA threonylcarbamoyladenosine biosynthesis protein TsaE